MAHTLGGVAFGTKENPFQGEIQYRRGTRWAVAKPLGYNGNIRTATGQEPLLARFRCWLDLATKDAIAALANAAYTSGTTHAWVYTDGDIGITSRTVLITVFDPKKNERVRGALLWDCDFELEEVTS